jgi:hypothetical protein
VSIIPVLHQEDYELPVQDADRYSYIALVLWLLHQQKTTTIRAILSMKKSPHHTLLFTKAMSLFWKISNVFFVADNNEIINAPTR